MSLTCKNKISLCLAIVILFTLLAGCQEDVEMGSGTPSIDFESQAHIQVGTSNDVTSTYTEESAPKEGSTSNNSSTPNDESTPVDASTPKEESTSYEQSQAPLTDEFVVSEKKYDYKGKNIELLHVENKTSRHFNVTINGKYLDKDGNVIKEETQKFTAFPAGWSNYFVFYPRTTFDSFTYTVDTEEYIPEEMHSDENGVPYASFIQLSYEDEIKWIRGIEPMNSEHPDDTKEVRWLLFNTIPKNTHTSKAVGIEYNVLIVDANGAIYASDYDYRDQIGVSGGWNKGINPVGGEEGVIQIVLKQQEIGEDETIPETAQKGKFTVIFVVRRAFDYDKWVSIRMEELGIK